MTGGVARGALIREVAGELGEFEKRARDQMAACDTDLSQPAAAAAAASLTHLHTSACVDSAVALHPAPGSRLPTTARPASTTCLRLAVSRLCARDFGWLHAGRRVDVLAAAARTG